MTYPTRALKAQFDLHTRLYNNALDGIGDAESNARHTEQVNHMKWIAGHLLNTRLSALSKIAGLAPDDSYVAQFGRGNSVDPSAVYPSIDEITARWNAASPAIAEAITKIPEEVLSAATPVKAPIADETISGLLSFLISHEAYHVGQLGLLRKLMGKEPMSYN